MAASLLIAAERYSLETFRGVGFSSRARGHRKGKREGSGAVVSGIRGAGAIFSVRFWRRNGGGRRGVSYTAVHRPPLLYEILIQGDIRQAYIRLACKSPPYLISRGCDAPGDDGSFYAAATFPSLLPLFVVNFDHHRVISLFVSARAGEESRNRWGDFLFFFFLI